MKNIKLNIFIVLGFFLLIPSFTFASTFNKNISYGTTGTSVAQLQQFLIDNGDYTGPVTSTFGPATKTALILFQTQEGIIPATGYVGSITRAHINKITSLHPEWLTTLSTTNTYSNINGNTIQSPAYTSNGDIPAGATAQCRDGSYSFSLNHRGSCSHHGGVSKWL